MPCVLTLREHAVLGCVCSDDALICITVYRKGAAEVVRRLQQALEATQQWQDTSGPTKPLGWNVVPCDLF